MSKFTDIISKGASLVNGKRAQYNYKVGEKSTSKGLPFDVKLSIDPDFKKTVIKSVSILSAGIGLGVVVGIFISRKK